MAMGVYWEIFQFVVGPFLGAGIALIIERYRSRAEKRSSDLQYIQISLLLLVQQYNSAFSIKKWLEEYRHAQNRHVAMPPLNCTFASEYTKSEHFAFLLTSASIDLVHRVKILEDKYKHLEMIVTQRKDLLMQVRQRSAEMESPGLILNAHEDAVLLSLTDGIYASIDDYMGLFKSDYDELHRTLKAIYPREKFLKRPDF